jgi:hypothetical protein
MRCRATLSSKWSRIGVDVLVFPQLTTGAFAQFPVRKQRQKRTITNILADMSMVKLADPQGEMTEWRLVYSGLSDAELMNLQQFHLAAEGSLNIFTFLDPTANLLAWSDELTNAAWSIDPFLVLAGGVSDPRGGSAAWHLSNSGGAPQTITQTLNTPGDYTYCVSAYARSAGSSTVTLLLGGNRATLAVGNTWMRIVASGHGDPTTNSIAFGLEVPAGVSLDVFGMQVESQPAASGYKSSTTGGVYENAYLLDDTFSFTTTDVNHHSTTINIAYASRL